jgi:hypothetical protein
MRRGKDVRCYIDDHRVPVVSISADESQYAVTEYLVRAVTDDPAIVELFRKAKGGRVRPSARTAQWIVVGRFPIGRVRVELGEDGE